MAMAPKKKVTTRTDVGNQGMVNEVVNTEMEVNNDATEFVEEEVVVSEQPKVVKTVKKVDWIHRHI